MKQSCLIFSFFLLMLLFFSSCDKSITYQDVDCSQCFDTPPDSSYLHLEITINTENTRVPVTVYRGTMEDNDIRCRDTIASITARILVPVNHDYSVTATYVKDGKTIIAVDGTKLQIKKAIGQCDNTCYVVVGGTIDLRIRK